MRGNRKLRKLPWQTKILQVPRTLDSRCPSRKSACETIYQRSGAGLSQHTRGDCGYSVERSTEGKREILALVHVSWGDPCGSGHGELRAEQLQVLALAISKLQPQNAGVRHLDFRPKRPTRIRGRHWLVPFRETAARYIRRSSGAPPEGTNSSRLVSAPVSMTIAATKEAAVVPALAISVWVWPSLRAL
jgi:hypothetical protein